jgi:hypothetical protein
MPGSSAESAEAFVRRVFQRLNADGIQAMAEEFFDPQIEYYDDAAWPGGGAQGYVGRVADGRLVYFRAYYDAAAAIEAVGF